MGQSKILITISRFLFPFVILFGIYIIVNGDLSVGGGFQGGVVIASSYLIYYIIVEEHAFPLSKMIKVDKYFYILIPIFIYLSFFTKGELFTNFFPDDYSMDIRRIYLIILNLLIGIKVALGFISVLYIFLEEGNQ